VQILAILIRLSGQFTAELEDPSLDRLAIRSVGRPAKISRIVPDGLSRTTQRLSENAHVEVYRRILGSLPGGLLEGLEGPLTVSLAQSFLGLRNPVGLVCRESSVDSQEEEENRGRHQKKPHALSKPGMFHHGGGLMVVRALGAEAGPVTIHPQCIPLLFYCTKLNNLPSNKKKVGLGGYRPLAVSYQLLAVSSPPTPLPAGGMFLGGDWGGI
jgi:hypothetical protein